MTATASPVTLAGRERRAPWRSLRMVLICGLGGIALLYLTGYLAFRRTHHSLRHVLSMRCDSRLDAVASVFFKPIMLIDRRLTGVISVMDPFDTDLFAAERGIDYRYVKSHAFAGDEWAVQQFLRFSLLDCFDLGTTKTYACDIEELRVLNTELFQRILENESEKVRSEIARCLAYARPDQTDP